MTDDPFSSEWESRMALRAFLGNPSDLVDARAFLRRTLDAGVDVDVATVDDAVLALNELATNAIVYAPGGFEVELRSFLSILHIAVSDHSFAPATRRPTGRIAGGFGLNMVDALAIAWGQTRESWGKTVWCDLAMRAHDAPGAPSWLASNEDGNRDDAAWDAPLTAIRESRR